MYATQRAKGKGQSAAAALLLALTLLANFFNAITASIMIAATVVCDLIRYRRAEASQKPDERRAIIHHVAAPITALCLTLFWMVPMLAQYEYLITRPYILEFSKLVSPALLGWYVAAIIGSVAWLRRPTRAMWPYLGSCLALAVAVIFAGTIAPPWFPLQSSRFLNTLNFLLAIPVGQAMAAGFRGVARLLGEIQIEKVKRKGQRARGKVRNDASTVHTQPPLILRKVKYTTGIAVAVLALLAITSPGPKWAYAFYAEGEGRDVQDILAFARQHRDGRYLVEVINPQYTDVAFDARAINSYLGAQGNETLSAVFHEASPNTLFMLPLVNAFSQYPDSFGISSMLTDDLDFAEQPLARHIERTRSLGVRYLVMRSPEKKDRVAKEAAIGSRHDFGWWTVFELKSEPAPHVRVLPNRPSLLVSGFTLKQRRTGERSFIRYAEEQFATSEQDLESAVLLVRSVETRLDRLGDTAKLADQFGALVVDTYDFSNADRAFEWLRDFAHLRPLLLLSSNANLFRRIQSSLPEFPLAEVIERERPEPGEPLDTIKPTRRYDGSAIRKEWLAIHSALERAKSPVESKSIQVIPEIKQNSMKLKLESDGATIMRSSELLPVLTSTTFHPAWRRDDGQPIYAATPFYMLTFLNDEVHLTYGRRWYERAAVWISAVSLLMLFVPSGLKRLRR